MPNWSRGISAPRHEVMKKRVYRHSQILAWRLPNSAAVPASGHSGQLIRLPGSGRVQFHAGSCSPGAFYEFSLKACKGCLFSLKRLALVLRVQPDGPKAYILTYSTDGEHFIDIGAPVRVGSTGNDGKLQKPIDLSAVPELQNVPAKRP